MRSQMLAKSQPNLLDIGNDNDSDIYDGSSSLRSGTSTNTLNEDEIEKEAKGKHKVLLVLLKSPNMLIIINQMYIAYLIYVFADD